MAELADAIDLGSIVNRRAGSSPVIRMKYCNTDCRMLYYIGYGAKRRSITLLRCFCAFRKKRSGK